MSGITIPVLLSAKPAPVTTPVIEPIVTRWSPRAFDETHVITDEQLDTILEAASWSPSASNTQPWRFIVGKRGTETFDKLYSSLMGFNQEWAGKASVLIAAVAVKTKDDGTELVWSHYDLGQASAYLMLQAAAEKLHSHPMGGIHRDQIAADFELPENFDPVSVIALGVVGELGGFSEKLQQREIAPRERLSVDQIVLKRD